MGRPLAGLPGGNARLGAFLPALPSSGTTQDRILRHRDSLSAAGTDPLLRSIDRREAIDRTSAVVLRDAVAVKSSPDQNSTDLFILHEGTKVEISDRLNGWCEITIADGKKGWMECSTFETI